jgi:5'-3' exonuclease
MSLEKMKQLQGLVDLDEIVWRVGKTVDEDAPPSHSLHNIKKVMMSLWEKFDHVRGFLSGSDNFRYKVATVKGYKENRKGTPKPVHYEEIREYLVDKWQAEIVDGREADDAIGEAQSLAESNTTCIVGQDKDFKTIPGWHYNPVKDYFFYVTPEQATRFFLYQLITGDTADNIPGIPNYGPTKAKKVLEVNRTTERAKKAISELYQQAYGDRWKEVIHEQATLLFIHREPGKTYQDYIGGF